MVSATLLKNMVIAPFVSPPVSGHHHCFDPITWNYASERLGLFTDVLPIMRLISNIPF